MTALPPSSPAVAPAGGGGDKSRIKTTMDEKVILTRTPDEETADGRIRNKEAVKKIRDTWIYKQIRIRQDEFTQYRKVCNNVHDSKKVKCLI
jgi:hypothetical protein